MRFLRALKPRHVEAARTGVNEEDEEGRQGLLPLTCKHEQSSAYLHKGAVEAMPKPLLLNSKLEQEAACTSQIVVLQASIHCQGCARRVKKILSNLQGVNTYHVDMEQQKVTVIGNVCPDNVLQSVNKVIKGAQFWASPQQHFPHQM